MEFWRGLGANKVMTRFDTPQARAARAASKEVMGQARVPRSTPMSAEDDGPA
jgi:hypothetical protein